MNHSIILIPTAENVDLKMIATTLGNQISDSKVFGEFNLDEIETLLSIDNKDELLESIVKQYESSSTNNKITIFQGVSLAKPYAASLNFSIATALGSAIIFVGSTKTPVKQTKIIINSYQIRYKKTILGFIADNDIDAINLPFLGNIEEKIDLDKIQEFLSKPFVQPITPPIFKYRLIERAKNANKKIVLPEGEDPRTIEAANISAEREIARPFLLGKKERIIEIAKELNITLNDKIEILDPENIRKKYVTSLYEIRKEKGMTEELAKEQLKDDVMLGTMMLHLGEVDGLVSGAVHTTANTIRPAFQIVKTPKNVKLVSSIFFMCLPDGVVVYGDCAINPNPTSEELADIAIQSALSAKAFGISPKIAMLSYSTGSSGRGPDVDRVKKATEIVKKLRPDLEIEGPIQYDAAVSEKTAKIKLPKSKVAGHANVFVMPTLDVGNVAYKTVQQNTGIVCIGPMLQGLKKPVNDLSRGCTVKDIVFTIAVTAIQAESAIN